MIINYRDPEVRDNFRHPVEVVDGLGEKIPNKVWYLNTESGEVRFGHTDKEGKVVFDEETQEMVSFTDFYPTPFPIVTGKQDA